jgi:hypothetical protein
MRAAGWLLLLGLAPQGPDAGEEARRAAGWVLDADPELRAIGRRRLLELGRAAIPAVEERLKEKGVLDLVQILREIAGAGAPAPDPYAFTREAPELDPPKDAPKLEKEAVDRYVNAKYHEAAAYALKGHYQRGYDMARALETLEPKVAAAEKIRRLRRYCEHMVTQTTLLEAKVVQDRRAWRAGEPVELALRLRNLFKGPLTVRFDPGTAAEPAGGLAVVEVEIRVTGLQNESTILTRHQEVRFEAEIPIAPGAQWEKRFTLDTSFEPAPPAEIAVFTVNAWIQPLKLEADGRDVTRRIQFEPAIVRVVPAAFGHFLENPLEWLGKTIDSRPAQETYLCAQLLSEDEKEPALELLIRAMERTNNPGYREALSWILLHLTGERLGPDPRKWAEWRDGRHRGKKAK